MPDSPLDMVDESDESVELAAMDLAQNAYDLGYKAARSKAASRIAELEQAMRLVRGDIKTALGGYGDDALHRALSVIEDAKVAPPVSLGSDS